MFAHITNNLDVAVSVVAVCVVSLTVPSQYWSVKYICSDIGLFLFAIFAYWVMWRFKRDRDRPKKGCQEACTASILESPVDESELELSAQVASEVVEVIKAEVPQFDVSSQMVVMQKYANERNIAGTMRTFRLIKKNGVPPTSQMYNIVLQAWINCGNVQAAEDLMEEITGAGLADETTYNLLIKVLVATRSLDKANAFFKDMKKASLTPSVGIFDNLLSGFARERRFNESLALLEEMHAGGVLPSNDTLNNIVRLLNGSRNIDQSLARIQQLLLKYNIDAASAASPVPVAMPRLAAVISQTEESKTTCCAHEMQITGSMSQIKAVRKTLKQHGLLDNTESDCSPLDGHWETDHGLTVIVEGKLVRWSAQRASKLSFTNKERTRCTMSLYGEATNGRLVSPATSPHASKSLVWENGDVWQSYEGRVIGQDTFFSQCMTKMVRDQFQDLQYQARSSAMLKCVSRQALNIPVMLEQSIVEFLGNDLYYVRVRFESKSNPSKKVSNDDDDLGPLPFEEEQDTCNAISLRHPRVGLRHCWAEKSDNSYGQRTLVNGQEVNEDDFSRHVQYVCWA